MVTGGGGTGGGGSTTGTGLLTVGRSEVVIVGSKVDWLSGTPASPPEDEGRRYGW
jgi:hypothetical protein